jgi:hypothetical protein
MILTAVSESHPRALAKPDVTLEGTLLENNFSEFL